MTIEFVQLLQDMLGDLEGNPEPIEVKIFGDDLPTLATLAERTSRRSSKKIDGVVDIVGAAARQPGDERARRSDARREGRVHRRPGRRASSRPACSARWPRSSAAATG